MDARDQQGPSRERRSSWQRILSAALVLSTSNTWAFLIGNPSAGCFRSSTRLCSTESSLEQLTVKELRQMIRDSEFQERGLLSRLKRKQDLIEYLEQNPPTTTSETAATPSSPLEQQQQAPPSKAMRLNGMPPLLDELEEHEADDDDELSPKDILFEQIYERYPPLREENCTGIGENDVRQQYHPMFTHTPLSSDMDLTFVGTASCTPGVTRGVSCTALRLNWRRQYLPTYDGHNGDMEQSGFIGGTWLFDVGEATQLQVQRTSSVRPGKITKIFLTHAHGDHTFGLPGLLCLMGQNRDRDSPPVDIYGPEGLRMWLRVAIRYSVARIVPHYRVHEIMDVPMAPEWERNRRTQKFTYRSHKQPGESWGPKGLAGEDSTAWITRSHHIHLEPSRQYGELDGGRDIFPVYGHPLSNDGAPVWEVDDEDDVKVYAAPMSHSVPCLGYVVKEADGPGRLRNEVVEPIVKRNIEALKDAGFRVPMKAMRVIKNLPEGNSFTFPDGTVVTQSEAVEPPRRGRKVVICGDTANCRAIEELAKGADALVHEATNTYLSGVDKNSDMREATKDAKFHGHSTPAMAGEFAKRIGAKRLLLNHFSARYKGDQTVDGISLMTRIERQAMNASGMDESQVAAAWDLMVLPIPQN